MYKQGELVAALLPSGIEHWGVATGNGTVISASKRVGFVVEESIHAFSSGYPTVSKGYPSNLPVNEVLNRAFSSLGKKWNLLFDNCQHFAMQCHDDKHSPQLQKIGFVIVVLAIAYLFSKYS